MLEWLRFMAQLAQAQHVVATTLGPLDGPDEAAVVARMPPLAAEWHQRGPGWLDGLAMLLDDVDSGTNSAPARAAMERLRGYDDAAVECLADRFLRGVVDTEDAAAALYVA